MAVTPTSEQLEIISAVSKLPSSLMISAYAGTAKTTTLQLAAPGIRSQALALAFNKKISEELKGRLPPHFMIKTLNGLGHSAWASSINTSIKLDERKLGKLVSQVAKDFKTQLTPDQWDETKRLVSAAMSAGISPGDIGNPLKEDSQEAWEDLSSFQDKEFLQIYPLAREVLKEDIRLAQQGIISFDDQIYCPTILGGKWNKYSTVFIDESQDLSPLNHRQLQLSLAQNGRLVAVGDPKQAIYHFRGADSSSMSNMRGLSKDWTDLQLTMTFRCPKVIVNRQQSHAPGYKAWDGCFEGQAFSVEELHTNLGTFNDEAKDYWSINDILNIKGLDKLDGNCAILCRNNAPLLSLAFKLLRRNIGCHMLGREIGRGLENLSQKLASDDSIPIVQFASKLLDWESHECSLARVNNKPDKESRIIDQAECLRAVIDGSGARTAGDLRGALQKLFSRDSGLITLSSIHRAKGLEWDLVVHLDPWRIPPKRSLQNPIQLEQEKNLLYVCETRTRHTLLNLNLEDFR